MKTITRLLFAALAIFAFGFFNTSQEGQALSQDLTHPAPQVLMAAVALNEFAERELIKQFRHVGSWLGRVTSRNQWVNNNVIRLTEIGADPAVLINNNTYPIAVSSRTDDSVAVSLYKYDTENTKVSEDEIYALPYDKPGSVQEQHRLTLEETTQRHGLHSIAPMANTASTPVIVTTGALVNGRRRLTYDDLVNFKQKLDVLKVPKVGRALVLSSHHISDLLLEDKALAIQYQNHTAGQIATNYVGFQLFEDVDAPVYDGATRQKIAFGSVTPGLAASVAFHFGSVVKARGTVARFMRAAENDPENRQTVVGFRLWHLVIPTRTLGQGAIIDATV
jgi:hypothetical protein